MKFTTYNNRPKPATRSDLATALSHLERMLHRATVYVGADNTSFETTLTEPAVTTSKKMVSSFMERLMAVHTFTRLTMT